MKRCILTFYLLLNLIGTLEAQILNINYEGASIPSRYNNKIEKTLLNELGFFGPLGLPDTVRVKLLAFKDRVAGETFLSQYDPQAIGNRYSGMFLPKIQTAVLISTENMDSGSRTICHEICHFLYHKIMDSTPGRAYSSAYGLNEGLACFFETFEVKKNGSVHQVPNRTYINSVKTLIEIEEFNLDEYLNMNGRRFESLSLYNGSVAYHGSYVIVATLFEHLGIDRMRELLATIRSGLTYEQAVEQIYPGGKSALMEGIREFVMKGSSKR